MKWDVIELGVGVGPHSWKSCGPMISTLARRFGMNRGWRRSYRGNRRTRFAWCAIETVVDSGLECVTPSTCMFSPWDVLNALYPRSPGLRKKAKTNGDDHYWFHAIHIVQKSSVSGAPTRI